jgi:hypothetical protein
MVPAETSITTRPTNGTFAAVVVLRKIVRKYPDSFCTFSPSGLVRNEREGVELAGGKTLTFPAGEAC